MIMSTLQHCWDRPEYWEVSWTLEETCCHLNSSGKSSAHPDVKNPPVVITLDYAVQFVYRIKLKECEKKDKYLVFDWELKKLWNMKVIPIVIGAFGKVTKGLLKGLEDLEVGGRVEAIQTITLLRTVSILGIVLETCCHSNSSERPSAYADVKNSKGL